MKNKWSSGGIRGMVETETREYIQNSIDGACLLNGGFNNFYINDFYINHFIKGFVRNTINEISRPIYMTYNYFGPRL
jgi:hypothetical protein